MQTVTITLKAKFHALIISFIPDKSRTDVINYIIQVAKAINGDYDPEADIAVTVTNSLVSYAYYTIGSYPERVVASDNKAIKEALIPQLADSLDLLAEIQKITANNALETEANRQKGIDFILSIAP